MKRSHKVIRRMVLAAVVVLTTSGALFGAYRALTGSAPDVRPLSVMLKPQDFTLEISANGELQSVESIAVVRG